MPGESASWTPIGGSGVGEGVGEGDGVGEAVGEGVSVGDGVSVGVAVGELDPGCVAVADGSGLPVSSNWPKSAVHAVVMPGKVWAPMPITRMVGSMMFAQWPGEFFHMLKMVAASGEP